MITKVKDALYGKKDLIIEILEELGAENINPNVNPHEIRWGGKGGNKIDVNTLSYVSFSHSEHGDILTLVCSMKGYNKLGDGIRWLSNRLGLSYEAYKKVEVKPPFGGFWKQYSKIIENDETPPPTYDLSRLDEFNIGVSKLFIDDGISAITQEEFNVGYDSLSNRFTIPWYNVEGELLGIMGRLNQKEIGDKQNKYLPIIPFRKSKALYGLNINYKNILNKNCIVIVESEKSVMKAHQYGIDNVVALGGNKIHSIPKKLIKSLHCDVIIALDEGLELKHSIEQAKKVQINNPFFTNNTYVLDMKDMPKKSCIFDLDYEEVQKAFSERLIYID